MDFKTAETLFAKARVPANGKPLCNNTRLFRRGEDCYAVRFHDTDVVTLWRDGRVTLDTGGWTTMSTKDRISSFGPVRVDSERGTWYISHDKQREHAERKARKEFGLPAKGSIWEVSDSDFPYRKFYSRVNELARVPFTDGITFDKRGKPLNGITPARWQKHLRDKAAMTKRIQTYCTAFNRALATEGLPMPSGGDCWYCLMIDEDGKTWGDHGSHDHLLGHMDENYFVPSLAVNALRAKGYSDTGIYMFLCMDPENNNMGGANSRYRASDGSMGGNVVRRALRDYLFDRLLPKPPGPNEDVRRPLRDRKGVCDF